jgi:hypothetical protein
MPWLRIEPATRGAQLEHNKAASRHQAELALQGSRFVTVGLSVSLTSAAPSQAFAGLAILWRRRQQQCIHLLASSCVAG